MATKKSSCFMLSVDVIVVIIIQKPFLFVFIHVERDFYCYLAKILM